MIHLENVSEIIQILPSLQLKSINTIQDGSIPDLDSGLCNKLIEKIIIPAIESNTNGLWSAKIIELTNFVNQIKESIRSIN